MPYSPPKPATRSEWVRVSEVATRLDVNPRTVLAMLRDGRLPVRYACFGATTRIHRADFEKDLEGRSITAATHD